MPIPAPSLDNRTFNDLVAQLIGRIPIHNPEWTNFNRSDPGITILELAAFLLENDIYVANQIPERNRLKFLNLLGIPLHPAASANGLVTFADDRGPLTTLTLNSDISVVAGKTPFRTTRGLDVLPVQAQMYFKRAVDRPDLLAYYQMLYASQTVPPPVTAVGLYETAPMPADGVSPDDAIDKSVWIAVLARPTEKDLLDDVRRQLAGRTLSLGVVPSLPDEGRQLLPTGTASNGATGNLRVFIPKLPPGGLLPDDVGARVPAYEALPLRFVSDVLSGPGVVEVTLPNSPAALSLWSNMHALESGVGDFPPSIDDTEQAARLITWLRVRSPVPILWMGINCASVTQRAHVSAEVLPDGTGDPDQSVTLSQRPVLPATVVITVTPDLPDAVPQVWQEIDDLFAAGPEVPAPDPSLPPGITAVPNALTQVYTVDAEAGLVRFGDGVHGARPSVGARIRADYDFGVGKAGNLGPGAIAASPALPSGWTVTNAVSTWGGADAESVDDAEKQIPRYLQHRDRLVNVEDYEVLALRTPGVAVGRVEVLPAFHPDLSPNLPGDAAGVVTLMLLPQSDPTQPSAPEPDVVFLDAVACWLEPKRLVTTELVLRGPTYVPVQLALAIEVVPGLAAADVTEAVKEALTSFLSPLPPPGTSLLDDRAALLSTPADAATQRGWPLGKSVIGLELQAVASRVPGVQFVHPVNVYQVTLPATSTDAKQVTQLDPIPLVGLQLPYLVAVEVGVGDTPPPVDDTGTTTPSSLVPVPVIPEDCS
ncbi:MAG TPA: baseplate J/gp47 family protein [Polyangia bacterium]